MTILYSVLKIELWFSYAYFFFSNIKIVKFIKFCDENHNRYCNYYKFLKSQNVLNSKYYK